MQGVFEEEEAFSQVHKLVHGQLCPWMLSKEACGQSCPQAPPSELARKLHGLLMAIKEAVKLSWEGSRATMPVNHPVKGLGGSKTKLENPPPPLATFSFSSLLLLLLLFSPSFLHHFSLFIHLFLSFSCFKTLSYSLPLDLHELLGDLPLFSPTIEGILSWTLFLVFEFFSSFPLVFQVERMSMLWGSGCLLFLWIFGGFSRFVKKFVLHVQGKLLQIVFLGDYCRNSWILSYPTIMNHCLS